VTREPASASHPARGGRGLVAATTHIFLQPTGSPTQYEVIADAQIVGRITLTSSLRHRSKPWVWSINLAFSDGHEPVHGFEATRDAAMEAFARSWFGESPVASVLCAPQPELPYLSPLVKKTAPENGAQLLAQESRT
jgi:hypothetical protein